MFTGIVEEIGTVSEASLNHLVVEARNVLEGTKVGDSIAVNGVCLTVSSLTNSGFSVDVMPETLRRSNLGQLHYGDRVNLEMALKVNGRLGGHLVLGHIDDAGIIESIIPEDGASIMRISAPSKLLPYMVEKGFIAVDGVSLTVMTRNASSFQVSVVDYTRRHTLLGDRQVGDLVNLEVDIIAKYVEQLSQPQDRGITTGFLQESGFL